MLRKTFFPILAFFFILFASSCTSVRKTIESGNYDRAIEISVKKLKGKKDKKEEYVKALEFALQKANSRDLSTIDHLLAENNDRNWERINGYYKSIQRRQAKIYPLLPLVAKSGYRANFAMADVASLEYQSHKKAAEFVYNNAMSLLKKGEDGNRVAAREAYEMFGNLNRYNVDLPNVVDLRAKAKAFGTSHILVELRNQSPVALPRDFEYRLMNLSRNDLNSPWLVYHFDKNDLPSFDYKVVLKMNNIDVSPERLATRDYVDENKVEDGWEYILDARGNVKKDSFGNDMKQKKFSIVRAFVRETQMTKAAKVGGDIEIYDFHTRALLDSDRITTEVVFEHCMANFSGDPRALSPTTCRRIDTLPLPFPSDFTMLEDAADRLKPMLRDRLKSSRMII